MPRPRWAGFNATATLRTGLEIVFESAVLGVNGMFRAGSQALPAQPAASLDNDDFRLGRKAFRIVTPPAAQRAPFEEYCGADPRPVLNGIFLYVEY